MEGRAIYETKSVLVRLLEEGNEGRERVPELAAGNLRTCAVGRRVGQPGMNRVGDYGSVGNVEGYHRLGHGGVQNYLGGLGCRRETTMQK